MRRWLIRAVRPLDQIPSSPKIHLPRARGKEGNRENQLVCHGLSGLDTSLLPMQQHGVGNHVRLLLVITEKYMNPGRDGGPFPGSAGQVQVGRQADHRRSQALSPLQLVQPTASIIRIMPGGCSLSGVCERPEL